MRRREQRSSRTMFKVTCASRNNPGWRRTPCIVTHWWSNKRNMIQRWTNMGWLIAWERLENVFDEEKCWATLLICRPRVHRSSFKNTSRKTKTAQKFIFISNRSCNYWILLKQSGWNLWIIRDKKTIVVVLILTLPRYPRPVPTSRYGRLNSWPY